MERLPARGREPRLWTVITLFANHVQIQRFAQIHPVGAAVVDRTDVQLVRFHPEPDSDNERRIKTVRKARPTSGEIPHRGRCGLPVDMPNGSTPLRVPFRLSLGVLDQFRDQPLRACDGTVRKREIDQPECRAQRYSGADITTACAHDLGIPLQRKRPDPYTGVIGRTVTEPHGPRRMTVPGLEEIEPPDTIELLVDSVQWKVDRSSDDLIHSAHSHMIAP